MWFKVFIFFFFFAIIQSKTLNEVNHSPNKIETQPLVVPNSLHKENEFNEKQLAALLSDLEVWQEEMIQMANMEITSMEMHGNSSLKIDKELIKKLIENSGKLLDALVRVGRAVYAIVKDITPL